MKQFVKVDPWRIIEDGFSPANNLNAESIFSIGNGKMGQRANFEEDYSGTSLKGNYLAGIYYPDKTRVGWWKNGYPEYFAKVLNAVEWMGLHIRIDGELLDLNRCEVISFQRILDMQRGILERKAKVKMRNGRMLKIRSTRFYSMVDDDLCLMKYAIQPIGFEANIQVESYLNFNVRNEDANYDENFWTPLDQHVTKDFAMLQSETKKTKFVVTAGMVTNAYNKGIKTENTSVPRESGGKVVHSLSVDLNDGDEFSLEKFVCIVSSFHYPDQNLINLCEKKTFQAREKGFEYWLKRQEDYWEDSWKTIDINIEGDDRALQGLRFNIFQLYQSYTGRDDRLNIGPKGFTGEKYGGSTYWDTEAFCLPFYLATAPGSVALNLLQYRYKHLDKAIENAAKLGFGKGAALFPMVTMTGEECHNEWEITFEEIHRNGAIAYAIFDYIKYTGNKYYLLEGGLEVLIAISRFWVQRVHFSKRRMKYVMHGVTGPNEYENNVNNNWYTSYIARWCLMYTLSCINEMRKSNPEKITEIFNDIGFDFDNESVKWKDVIDGIYLPRDEELGVFLQQDGFLDKELLRVDQLDDKHLPLVKNWSWDRILRSCFIKQADVLQGLYFFEEDFTRDEIKRNFKFYEPMTVHESSLSPCIHSMLASSLQMEEKAYELFIRSARLDLDDFNSDTKDGCHITSMAGTWLAFVKGFGGMRVKDDLISFEPVLPKAWKSYSFSVIFKGARITVNVSDQEVQIIKQGGGLCEMYLWGEKMILQDGENVFDNNRIIHT